MIISRRNRFAFMHNPKVAGSSVRDVLERFRDEDVDLFDCDPDPTSPTHSVDRAHIGIDEFAQYYPDLWNRVRPYTFYVLFRDPAGRFFSSVNEYSRVYGDIDIRFAPLSVRADFLLRTVEKLEKIGSSEATMGHLQFTHFRPQWIYMQSTRDDASDIDIRPFALKDFAKFTEALSAQCETALEFPRENSSEHFAIGGPAARILGNNTIKKQLRRLPGAKQAMRLLRASSRTQTSKEALSPQSRYGLSDSDQKNLDGFISRFYKTDMEYFASMARLGFAKTRQEFNAHTRPEFTIHLPELQPAPSPFEDALEHRVAASRKLDA